MGHYRICRQSVIQWPTLKPKLFKPDFSPIIAWSFLERFITLAMIRLTKYSLMTVTVTWRCDPNVFQGELDYETASMVKLYTTESINRNVTKARFPIIYWSTFQFVDPWYWNVFYFSLAKNRNFRKLIKVIAIMGRLGLHVGIPYCKNIRWCSCQNYLCWYFWNHARTYLKKHLFSLNLIKIQTYHEILIWN